MKLQQVSSFLTQDVIDGWDDLRRVWVPRIAEGKVRVFDQFISDRNFGQTKRVLTVPGEGIPGGFLVIRVPAGTGFVRYFLEWQNFDTQKGCITQSIYQLRECPYEGRVKNPKTVKRGTGAVAAVKGEYEYSRSFFCSREFHLYRDAPDFSPVSHSLYDIHIPPDIEVHGDSLVEVDGVDYQVRSAAISLNLRELRAVERGYEA